jgi:hypothetical protein
MPDSEVELLDVAIKLDELANRMHKKLSAHFDDIG